MASADGSGQDYSDMTKLSPDGTQLEYSTYLRSPRPYMESGRGIAVGDNGIIYVAGYTRSPLFPTTPGASGIPSKRPEHPNYFSEVFVVS